MKTVVIQGNQAHGFQQPLGLTREGADAATAVTSSITLWKTVCGAIRTVFGKVDLEEAGCQKWAIGQWDALIADCIQKIKLEDPEVIDFIDAAYKISHFANIEKKNEDLFEGALNRFGVLSKNKEKWTALKVYFFYHSRLSEESKLLNSSEGQALTDQARVSSSTVQDLHTAYGSSINNILMILGGLERIYQAQAETLGLNIDIQTKGKRLRKGDQAIADQYCSGCADLQKKEFKIHDSLTKIIGKNLERLNAAQGQSCESVAALGRLFFSQQRAFEFIQRISTKFLADYRQHKLSLPCAQPVPIKKLIKDSFERIEKWWRKKYNCQFVSNMSIDQLIAEYDVMWRARLALKGVQSILDDPLTTSLRSEFETMERRMSDLITQDDSAASEHKIMSKDQRLAELNRMRENRLTLVMLQNKFQVKFFKEDEDSFLKILANQIYVIDLRKHELALDVLEDKTLRQHLEDTPFRLSFFNTSFQCQTDEELFYYNFVAFVLAKLFLTATICKDVDEAHIYPPLFSEGCKSLELVLEEKHIKRNKKSNNPQTPFGFSIEAITLLFAELDKKGLDTLQLLDSKPSNIVQPERTVEQIVKIATLGTSFLESTQKELALVQEMRTTDDPWAILTQFDRPKRRKKVATKGKDSAEVDELDNDEPMDDELEIQEVEPPAMDRISCFVKNFNSGEDPIKLFQETIQLLLPSVEHEIALLSHQASNKRAVRTYQEAFGHFFLANCGIEQLISSLRADNADSLRVIYPMLLIDWHAQIEQLMTALHIDREAEITQSHSLISVFTICDAWNNLSPEMRLHLEGIDRALLWARYPYSSLNRIQSAELPVGLKWLKRCMEGDQVTSIVLKDMVEYIMQAHALTMELFMDLIKLKTSVPQSEELLRLLQPGNYFDQEMRQLLSDKHSASNPASLGLFAAPMQKINEIVADLQLQFSSRPALIAAYRDARYHLEKIARSVQMGESSQTAHLRSWQSRNLMNFQWVFEQLYHARYIQLRHETLFIHDFAYLQELLGDTMSGIKELLREGEKEPRIDVIKEWNYGIGVHFPAKCLPYQKNLEPFVQLMQVNCKSYGIAPGFSIDKGKKKIRSDLFLSLQEKIPETLNQVASLLAKSEREGRKV